MTDTVDFIGFVRLSLPVSPWLPVVSWEFLFLDLYRMQRCLLPSSERPLLRERTVVIAAARSHQSDLCVSHVPILFGQQPSNGCCGDVCSCGEALGKMRQAPMKKALHSLCPQCYSASRFTENAVATRSHDSLPREPMVATKEITNKLTRNEAAALGFDYFFQPSQKHSDLEVCEV
jgi:hypothetical protein